MPKYVIHVGPHKTGSTYIQYGLLLNRQALAAKGILYPNSWVSDGIDWSHFGLFRMLRGRQYAEITSELAALASSSADQIVLSSEDLSILDDKELTTFRDLIGENADIKIVFYLRRWCELLPSNAQEEIRQGGTRILPEICIDHLARPFGSDTVNFMIKLERFARVFGVDSMRIVSFNNVIDEHLDLFHHFIEKVLEIDATGLPLPSQRHESQPITHIELLRAFNVIHKLRSSSPIPASARPWIANSAEGELSEIFDAMKEHDSFWSVDEFARPFLSIFSEVVESFGHVVLPPFPNNLIFKRQLKSVHYIAPNYALVNGMIDRLYEAYRSMTGSTAVAC